MGEQRQKRLCQTCGRTVPSFAPGGHCPHCLLRSTSAEKASANSSWESRFTILQELGEGGFGKVFLAEQHEPVRRNVALKVIKPGMDTREVIARFEAERQTLATLDHPNIAGIHDAGETADGYPAFAMEFVPGVPITRFVDDEALGLRDRLRLFVQVCRGVEHAHLKGVIHRDLKPSNLLAFHDSGGEAVVRIIDFGIAKATRQGASDATLVTIQPSPLGTPAYMSPEQADSRPDVDVRTDVYSLGAVLYELLSGAALHDQESSSWSEMLDRIRDESVQRPSKRLGAGRDWGPKDLEGDLDCIVLSAVSKDRDRRYQSVAALREDLVSYLDGRAVSARPPSKRYFLKKLILRHRVASAAVMAAVLALLAGSVVSTLMAIRASSAREQAEEYGLTAEMARSDSLAAFSRSDFQQGCRLLSDDEFESGVAYLCRALRTNPDNHLAADRLLTTLAYTNFLPPLVKEAHHPSRTLNVAFRNESEFVTVCEGGVVGVWDRQTGERLGEWLDHKGESIVESDFGNDGNLLATATSRRTVRVWKLGERELAFEQKNEKEAGALLTVALIDDRRVVAGFTGGWIMAWDFVARTSLWKEHVDHSVKWLTASPDGRFLAVSGHTEAYLLDSNDGARQPYVFPHDRLVRRARFSPDGSKVLTASLDGTARIWNVSDGSPASEPMTHDLSLYDATWAAGGLRVATAGFDSNARVWNATNGDPLTVSLRHDDHVYAALIPYGGFHLLTGSRDQKLRLWNARTGLLAAAPARHRRSVSSLVVDRERGQVLVSGRHEQVRMLDVRPRAAKPIRLQFPGKVSFAQSQDGGKSVRVLYRTDKGTVLERREVASGKALGKPLHLGSPPSLDAAKGNDRLVVRHDSRDVSIYGSTDGDLLAPRITFPRDLAFVEIDRDGRFVFVCDKEGGAELLKLDEPSEDQHGIASISLEPFPGKPVDDVIMLGEPLKIALKRGDTVRVYNLQEGEWMPDEIKHEGGIGAWDFNPEQNLLITGGYDDTARIWNAASGSQDFVKLEHADVSSGRAVRVKLSPDGKVAITSSWHELSARIWNASDGTLVTNPLYHNAHLESISIDPHSRYLATTDDARMLRIWSLEDGTEAFPARRLSDSLRRGRFASGGTGFLAADGDSALLWPLPAASHSTPTWVVALAESIVGRRLDDQGVMHWLPDAPHSELIERIPVDISETGRVFSEWFNWILSNPGTRTQINPAAEG